MTLNFLDKQLGKLIQPPKLKTEIEAEKRNKKYYMRLRRLCQKHGITYSRDLSYWDFSEPIGTVGMNENVDGYENAYWYVKEKLEALQS
tara:strand:- start:772 stop:1038 length:267 start_codon:yes stop_codon:yes gene_type:complete